MEVGEGGTGDDGRNWPFIIKYKEGGVRKKKAFFPLSHILFTKRLRPNSAALLGAVQGFPRLVLFLHTMEHEHKVYRKKIGDKIA